MLNKEVISKGVGPSGPSVSPNAQIPTRNQLFDLLRNFRDEEDVSDSDIDQEEAPTREFVVLIQFREVDMHILKCPVKLYEQIEK